MYIHLSEEVHVCSLLSISLCTRVLFLAHVCLSICTLMHFFAHIHFFSCVYACVYEFSCVICPCTRVNFHNSVSKVLSAYTFYHMFGLPLWCAAEPL